MIIVLTVVTTITFFVSRLLPGDPVSLWVGDHPTKEQLETAKKDLSEHLETTINLPFIYTESEEPKHLKATLTRNQLEDIIEPLVQRTKKPLEQSMKDAKLSYKDLDSILLVGGTTRIPKVKQFVEDLVGSTLDHKVDPEQSVALGAAIQAGVKRGKLEEMVIVDVAPHSLGIEVKDGKFSVVIPCLLYTSPSPRD